MAKSVIVDSGVLVALVRRDDQAHRWAADLASRLPAPWRTCEAALSEAFFVAGQAVRRKLADMLRRELVISDFSLAREQASVLSLMDKYADVPMSLADGCLVRMTEVLPDPILITLDADFLIYRRHGRQIIPCHLPHQG